MSTDPRVAAAITELAPSFSGSLLEPGADGYDAARRVHNAMIDRRPAVVAQCLGVADVVDAVRLARSHDLEIAIRGGGHNVAGRAVCEGGLMIDLSRMRGVAVDPVRRLARAQAGATWGVFNRETQLHGLATTGGVVSTTGVSGLTLGGGIGWLMSRHGLAIDNLRAVEIVTADGNVLRVSAEEHPDLFWALRGGGGNFGAVTALEYELHPVGPTIVGGLVMHPLAQAADLLRFYREITASLSDDLTAFAALLTAPDGTKVAGLALCHCGAPQDAARELAPIKSYGQPLMDAVAPMSYTQVNAMLDASYPWGAFHYWRSSFLPALTDEVIAIMTAEAERAPSPECHILVEHLHGAVTRVPLAATAFPNRTAGYNMLVLAQWHDKAATDACLEWGRRTYAALKPHCAERRYINYLDDEGRESVAAAYGPQYARLQMVKAQYDPENVFHLNQNVLPAAPAASV